MYKITITVITNLFGNLGDYKNPVKGSQFTEEFKVFAKKTGGFKGRELNPQRVGRLIYKAATTTRPRYYYHINNNPVLTILSWLPDRLIDSFVIRLVKRG